MALVECFIVASVILYLNRWFFFCAYCYVDSFCLMKYSINGYFWEEIWNSRHFAIGNFSNLQKFTVLLNYRFRKYQQIFQFVKFANANKFFFLWNLPTNSSICEICQQFFQFVKFDNKYFNSWNLPNFLVTNFTTYSVFFKNILFILQS